MNKIAIFILVAILFSVVSAVADTTYVCSEVGDWDQWNVPKTKQQEMVDKDIVMEITIYDINDDWQIEARAHGGEVALCRPSTFCNKICTSGEVHYNKCPCYYCVGTGSGPLESAVNEIVDLLLEIY